MPFEGRPQLVLQATSMSGNDIHRISVECPDRFDPKSGNSAYHCRVRLEFTDEGETTAHRLALRHPAQLLAIIVDDKVIASPMLTGSLVEKGDWVLITRDPDLWRPFVPECTR